MNFRLARILKILLGLSITAPLRSQDWQRDASGPKELPWRLQIFGGLPELYGIQGEYKLAEWAHFYVNYAWPSLMRVSVDVKSKTLVKQDGVSIRSPLITLPFNVDLGPHGAVGFNLFPFRFPLFFGLGLERRDIKITSQAQSHFLFVDSEEQIFSNTLIEARVDSLTQQSMLRFTLGYEWPFIDDRWYISAFGGLTKVLRARTTVATDIAVINSQASNRSAATFLSLSEAEVRQESSLNDSGKSTIELYQYRNLPLLGLAAGVNF